MDAVSNLANFATGLLPANTGKKLKLDSTGNPAWVPEAQTLTDAATITWDTSLGAFANVVLGGNRTLAMPTGLAVGMYTLKVKQDATGGRTLSWPVGMGFAKNAPVIVPTPNGWNVFTFFCDGTTLWCTGSDFHTSLADVASLIAQPGLLAAGGYQKIAGGLIIQWGVLTPSAGSTVTFPLMFPSACFAVVGSGWNAYVPAGNPWESWFGLMPSAVTKNGFTNNSPGTGGGIGAYVNPTYWIALGN